MYFKKWIHLSFHVRLFLVLYLQSILYAVFYSLHICVIIVWPLSFCLLLVLVLYKEHYLQMFQCVSFWLHSFFGQLEGLDTVNRLNHTSWVAIVTPTNRLKSADNRYVIEVFGGVRVLSLCFWGFSVGEGAFVKGLSQISSFSLENQTFAFNVLLHYKHLYL